MKNIILSSFIVAATIVGGSQVLALGKKSTLNIKKIQVTANACFEHQCENKKAPINNVIVRKNIWVGIRPFD